MSAPRTAAGPDEARRHRLRKLDALLDQALALEEAEIPAFLASIEPASLRGEIESLLEAGQAPLDIEERWTGAIHGVAEGVPRPGAMPASGDVVGPWRLREVIGRGGMGTIFLAERCDGLVDMLAALKVAHQLCFDVKSRERFERERRILARLQHASIARFLDGGVSESGHPYLVMELVDGEPIDLWCDRRQLTVEQRLRLFVELARAVEAAHRELVLHRDLKPSNVLVTSDGGVKLLDFGIARWVDPGEHPDTTTLMTPEYASPEQCLGRPLSLATDIYQLGLLLYELLTGRQPQRVPGDSSRRLIQRICEDTPKAPSALVRSLDAEEAEQVAERRGTTARALERSLRGDLDVLVARALHKEPERRYRSAGELAADVESHLQGQPIAARQDTFFYRAGKFLRRHRLAAGSTAAAVALVALLVSFYTVRLQQERNEARAAQQASEAARQASDRTVAMLVGLFESVDPWTSENGADDVRRLLDEGEHRASLELVGQPLVRARLLDTIGWMRLRFGDHREALTLVQSGLELRRSLGAPPLELVESLLHRAGVATFRGELREAEPYFVEALDLLHGDDPESLDLRAEALRNYGDLLWRTDRYEESEARLLESVALHEQLGTGGYRYSSALLTLGNVHYKAGRIEAADEQWRRAFDIRRKQVGRDHLQVAPLLQNLGLVASRQGRDEEALDYFREAREIFRRELGETSPGYARSLYNLSKSLERLGRSEEARDLLHRSIAAFEGGLGPSHPQLIFPLTTLGDLAAREGDLDTEERSYRRALDIVRATYGEVHCKTSVRYVYWGRALESQGRLDASEAAFLRSVSILETHFEQTGLARPTYHAFALKALGEFYRARGRDSEAQGVLLRALEHAREGYGEGSDEVAEIEGLIPGPAVDRSVAGL